MKLTIDTAVKTSTIEDVRKALQLLESYGMGNVQVVNGDGHQLCSIFAEYNTRDNNGQLAVQFKFI